MIYEFLGIQAQPGARALVRQAHERRIVEWLEDFRLGAPSRVRERFATVANAPFPSFVLHENLPGIYPALYDSEYLKQHKRIVEELPLDILFDAFMQQIVDGTTAGAAQKAAEDIGKRLARKALRGAKASCTLDLSEKVNAPGVVSLFFLKLSSRLPLLSKCGIRRILYNAAKPQLIEARKDPATRAAVESAFQARYPLEFRKSFLQEVSRFVGGFAGSVPGKFGAMTDKRWNQALPILEDSLLSPTLRLKDWVAAFRSDITTAAYFSSAQEPAQRAMAAGLFYAAANRLIMMTGGRQSRFENGSLVLDLSKNFDPANPKVVPAILSDAFGGWGFSLATQGFSPWDWAAYPATPELRLFPSELEVLPPFALARPVGTGAEVIENLEDLAELLSAQVEFLMLTRPEGPLGRYFGDPAQLESILDTSSAVVFPAEGRALAVGIVAALLKNLLAEGVGHVEIQQDVKILFHETISGAGVRSNEPVRVAIIGKLLSALAELRVFLKNTADPAIPQDLLAAAPKLGQALQVGALTLTSEGQAPEGGFYDRMGVAQSTPEEKLQASVQGLTALTHAYNRSRMLPLRLGIRLGWEMLDRAWREGVLSKRSYLPSELWGWLKLWDQSQLAVRGDLAEEMDWTVWVKRMEALRELLLTQIERERHPVAVALRIDPNF